MEYLCTRKTFIFRQYCCFSNPDGYHGNIDFETLEKLIEFHINAGTDSIVSVGTTGESATLSIERKCESD